MLAKSLNSLGLAARKDGDHDSAVLLYREAAAADPKHVWSRYNLACELALAGSGDEALRLLEAIDAIGGEDASEALRDHAPRDKDFARLRGDPRFKALTTR
ncbi:MAG: tetratricopeptide repeat protein [Myxococcota bacterium]